MISPDRLHMPRGFANDLLQRIHEYNAYMNVLETGGSKPEQDHD